MIPFSWLLFFQSILLWQVSQSQVLTGSVFNSQGFEMWNWWTLICDDDVDCTVNCLSDHDCNRVTIIGPRNAQLTLNCLNDGACSCCMTVNASKSTSFIETGFTANIETLIYPSSTPNDGTVWSYYDYYQASAPYICPDNTNCTLNCYGSNSCFWATVIGPSNAELTINCDSSKDVDYPDSQYARNQACPYMNITARNSTKLTINVYNHPDEFSNSIVYAPFNPHSEVNTFITCGLVNNRTFTGPMLDVCGLNNHIYSFFGWDTIAWSFAHNTGWNTSIYSHSITMHCGPNYVTSCSSEVDWDHYKCQFNQCYGFGPTPPPTAAQVTTHNPTQYPTMFRTLTGSVFTSPGFEMWNFWTLICDDNVDCTVNCLSDHECNRVTIIGPRNAQLILNCLNHVYACSCCMTVNVTKSTGFQENGHPADYTLLHTNEPTTASPTRTPTTPYPTSTAMPSFDPTTAMPTLTTTLIPPSTTSNDETVWSYYDYYQASAPFICPDNTNCTLNCYGSYSCFWATVIGPSNGELTINCDSSKDVDYPDSQYARNQACPYMNITARNSTRLTINVYNHPDEFSNSIVYAPFNPQSPSEVNTFITCGLVNNRTFTGPIVDVCGLYNNIYSVFGWDTISWSFAHNTGWNTSIYSHSITMHCGPNYVTSCSSEVDWDHYKCQFNQCYGFGPTPPPTAAQGTTRSPTQYPTMFRTLTGSVFTSPGFEMWNWWTLICDDDVDCTVNCVQSYGCNRVTIIGPRNAQLTLNCLNDAGACSCCMTVNASKSTSFIEAGFTADITTLIPPSTTSNRTTTHNPTTRTPTRSPIAQSETVWSYYDYNQPIQPFICPDNINCTLNCYGSLSCWTAWIIGPANAELTINCDSSKDVDYPTAGYSLREACSEMIIAAQTSTKLTINVFNHPLEFSNNDIYAPNNSHTFDINTFITCGLVNNRTLAGPVMDVCGLDNHIYSVFGWDTVWWSFANNTGWDSSIYWHNITMHCGPNHVTSCSSELDWDHYKCDFGQCYGFAPTPPPTVTQATTTTRSPTQYPTMFRTLTGSVFTSPGFEMWNSWTLICDDDVDCTVNCFSDHACNRVTIIGPRNAQLILNCLNHTDACSCCMIVNVTKSTGFQENGHPADYTLLITNEPTTALPTGTPTTPYPTSTPLFDPTTAMPSFDPTEIPSFDPTEMPSLGPTTAMPSLGPTTAMPSFDPLSLETPLPTLPVEEQTTTETALSTTETIISTAIITTEQQDCNNDDSLRRDDCSDDDEPNNQCSVLIKESFEVCYVEPYKNKRGALWAGVKQCACVDVFEGGDLDDGITKECYVEKYFYANPSGVYAEYETETGDYTDCALQSVFRISVALYHSDCEYVQEIAQWLLDEGDSLQDVLGQCNLRNSEIQNWRFSEGFGRISNVSVFIKSRDKNGDSREVETGESSAVRYSVFVHWIAFSIIMFMYFV